MSWRGWRGSGVGSVFPELRSERGLVGREEREAPAGGSASVKVLWHKKGTLDELDRGQSTESKTSEGKTV